MASTGQALFGVLMALLMVKTSQGIFCYYCNSANNSACVDVEANEQYNIIPVVECESAIPSSIAVSFFCRKIVQTIYRHGHDSELRVTRGCGWVQHHLPCYKADNSDHLETVCQCFEDQCNASGALSSAAALILLTTTAVTGLGFWSRA